MLHSNGYLQITPAVAFTVLSETLVSWGVPIDEPDPRELCKVLSPNKSSPPAAMVSIPLDDSVEENYRETIRATRVSHEQVPNFPQFVNQDVYEPTTSTDVPNISGIINIPVLNFNFKQIELALLEQCSIIDEENTELTELRQTLSLSMMEAEFLRMQLRLLNLKARSILELFQYCDGSNAGFCRCPEIRKRIFELGILVQRQ